MNKENKDYSDYIKFTKFFTNLFGVNESNFRKIEDLFDISDVRTHLCTRDILENLFNIVCNDILPDVDKEFGKFQCKTDKGYEEITLSRVLYTDHPNGFYVCFSSIVDTLKTAINKFKQNLGQKKISKKLEFVLNNIKNIQE